MAAPVTARVLLIDAQPDVCRRIWDLYLETLPDARTVWAQLAEIYPDEGDRLRWLWTPNPGITEEGWEGCCPYYPLATGWSAPTLRVLDALLSGAFP